MTAADVVYLAFPAAFALALCLLYGVLMLVARLMGWRLR